MRKRGLGVSTAHETSSPAALQRPRLLRKRGGRWSGFVSTGVPSENMAYSTAIGRILVGLVSHGCWVVLNANAHSRHRKAPGFGTTASSRGCPGSGQMNVSRVEALLG